MINKKQKTVIVVGLILLLILISYPPWTYYRLKDNKQGSFISYNFFLEPPDQGELDKFWKAKIDVVRFINNSIIIIV